MEETASKLELTADLVRLGSIFFFIRVCFKGPFCFLCYLIFRLKSKIIFKMLHSIFMSQSNEPPPRVANHAFAVPT